MWRASRNSLQLTYGRVNTALISKLFRTNNVSTRAWCQTLGWTTIPRCRSALMCRNEGAQDSATVGLRPPHLDNLVFDAAQYSPSG